MKKFYEAPVVELTGFSVEDVITTSVTEITAQNLTTFTEAVGYQYKDFVDYAGTSGSYNW